MHSDDTSEYQLDDVGLDSGIQQSDNDSDSLERAKSKRKKRLTPAESKSIEITLKALDEYRIKTGKSDKDALAALLPDDKLSTIQNNLSRLRGINDVEKDVFFASRLLHKLKQVEEEGPNITDAELYRYLAKRSKTEFDPAKFATKLGSYLIFQRYFDDPRKILVGIAEFIFEDSAWLRFCVNRAMLNDPTRPTKAYTDGIILLGQKTGKCIGFTNETGAAPYIESLCIRREGENHTKPYLGFWSGLSFSTKLAYTARTVLVKITDNKKVSEIKSDAVGSQPPKIIRLYDEEEFIQNEFLKEIIKTSCEHFEPENIVHLLDENKAIIFL